VAGSVGLMTDRLFHASLAKRLDDPERLRWLPPAIVLDALSIQPGDAIADIGAGTGYFSLPLAQAAGLSGQVFAIDSQTEMLEHLQCKLDTGNISNIIPVRAKANSTGLPTASCNLVFLAKVWHEIEDQAAVLMEAKRILKSRGKSLFWIGAQMWNPDLVLLSITVSVLQRLRTPCNLRDLLKSGRAMSGNIPGSFRESCPGRSNDSE